MIDERHILINGECPISVHCEDYGSSASGGVGFLLIMPPAARVNISATLQTWSLIRDYLALDIVTEKMLFCQILIWGSDCNRNYFILPHQLWWKCFIMWKYFGCREAMFSKLMSLYGYNYTRLRLSPRLQLRLRGILFRTMLTNLLLHFSVIVKAQFHPEHWLSFMFIKSWNHHRGLWKNISNMVSTNLSKHFQSWHSQLRSRCRSPQSTSKCWPRKYCW